MCVFGRIKMVKLDERALEHSSPYINRNDNIGF